MKMFNKLMFVGGFCLFALMLVLISAQVITDDSGDSKIISVNGTVCNFTVTPHRTNDNTGFITLNIKTDKRINKTFTFKHSNQTNYTIDMNDSSSVSYNTPMFNVVDECNETLTLDEFNLTLNTVFKTQEISLLNILNLENRAIRTINPNDSIQTAIDNASAGDTILLNGGTYNQHDINVTKENLTIKASDNDDVPIINGEGQGRGFNVASSSVLIQGLTITNTTTDYSGSGGGIYIGGIGCSVSGCNFTNTTANSGGGVYVDVADSNVINCNFINNTANIGGGVLINVINGGGGSSSSVVFNRFINNTDNGVMVSNVYIGSSGSSNVSSNWWGNNTPQSITNGLMDDFYQLRLFGGDVSTVGETENYTGTVPIAIGVKLVKNGTINDSTGVDRLPLFAGSVSYNHIVASKLNVFRGVGLGDSVDWFSRDGWSDSVGSVGEYVLNGFMDNQALSLNISADPAPTPNPNPDPDPNFNPGSNSDDSNSGCNGFSGVVDGLGGLANTGLPLIFLFFLCFWSYLL
ncbi:MAG: Pseudogene of conserved hypothetical protein [Methanobrevibacter sp. CfCl-M3]